MTDTGCDGTGVGGPARFSPAPLALTLGVVWGREARISPARARPTHRRRATRKPAGSHRAPCTRWAQLPAVAGCGEARRARALPPPGPPPTGATLLSDHPANITTHHHHHHLPLDVHAYLLAK